MVNHLVSPLTSLRSQRFREGQQRGRGIRERTACLGGNLDIVHVHKLLLTIDLYVVYLTALF